MLNPDVIALQEVLAPWQYQSGQEQDSMKVLSEQQSIPQVRRLVGKDYTIICNSRNQFECIAVKSDFGQIAGCIKGELCNTARTGPELDGCDNGFTVSAATVILDTGFKFDIVNVHPQSTSQECRAKMIALIFQGSGTLPPLIENKNVLIMGDFNLDPWRDSDESAILWQRFFKKGWAGKAFSYHSGIAEISPPRYTTYLVFGKTYDFVVSNFAFGNCYVLGETPGTKRLDDGSGTDHRAIFGTLAIEE